MSLKELNERSEPEMERLSTLYNADVGLYMLANKVVIYLSMERYALNCCCSGLLISKWLVDRYSHCSLMAASWSYLVMVYVQWMVDEKELKVIHYTLGPLKPWDWWTAWLLKPVDLWQVLMLDMLSILQIFSYLDVRSCVQLTRCLEELSVNFC